MPTDPAEARAAARRVLAEIDIHTPRNSIGLDEPSLLDFEDDITLVAAAYLEAADREARLQGVRPLISQALSRKEMPLWRYSHYYGGDERTTVDLLREALNILEALAPASGGSEG